jgi:DNA-binding response OmpR family regulator
VTPVEVLVASPDAGLRGQVALALGGQRFEVVEATDTDEAVSHIASRPPAVLVADLRLEGRGALALARTLRTQPETDHIRVLVLTSAEARVPEDAVGIDGVLATPFTSLALLRRVEAQLGR